MAPINPTVSVIVTNYNNAPWIGQCLDSVINQTWKELEIIVADDCSTDGSREIAVEYGRKYPAVKVLLNNERLNVSRNRQKAIAFSTGVYITTLDGDDFLVDSRKIEMEMNLIIRYLEKENREICAFSGVMIADDQSRILGTQWPESSIVQGDIFRFIFARSAMIPRDFIFSRKQYEMAGGYDSRYNLFEDWDLKIRLSRNSHFYYTGIRGIGYRRKGTGLSCVPVAEHIAALRDIWKKNEHLIREDEADFILNKLSEHLDYMAKNQK